MFLVGPMSGLVHYSSPDEFLDRIAEACLGREAELGLLLGLAAAAERAFACTLEEGDAITAALLRTAPFGFVVAAWATGSAGALARAVKDAGLELDAPSVVGTAVDAEEFAREWREAPRLIMSQSIYEVREVIPMNLPPEGELRPARQGDLDRVVSWSVEFADEAEGRELDAGAARAIARRRIASGELFVWDTGTPVAMVGLTRETFTGIALNSVYTPPELRRNGYATAAVAAVSRRALASGRSFCCLYTDAANPTSNVIYQRVGYRFLCESAIYELNP